MIDGTVIANLKELERDGNPGILGDLVRLFRRNTAAAIEELASTAAATDADRLSRCAHSLKSSCGNLGALRLMELAVRLEQCAKDGDFAKAGALIGEFREEFRVAEAELGRLAGC